MLALYMELIRRKCSNKVCCIWFYNGQFLRPDIDSIYYSIFDLPHLKVWILFSELLWFQPFHSLRHIYQAAVYGL